MGYLADLLRQFDPETIRAMTGSATADGTPRLPWHEDMYVNNMPPSRVSEGVIREGAAPAAFQADVRRAEPPMGAWADGRMRTPQQEDDYANSGLIPPKPIPAYPTGPGFDPMENELDRMAAAVGRNRMAAAVGRNRPQADPALAPARAALSKIMSPPAEPEELPMNSFRNERTGKITRLQSAPDPAPDVLPVGYSVTSGYEGPGAQVVQSMRQPNGTILQVIRKPVINGAGQQSMATEFRTLTADAVDPVKRAQAEAAHRAAQTAALTPEGRQAAARAEARGKAQGEQDTAANLTPEQRRAKAAQAWGVRPQPGEAVDMDTGRVYAVPGGAAWRKQQDTLREAENQRNTTITHANAVLNNIRKLIGERGAPVEHEGLRGATGMIDALLPGLTPAQTNARKLQEALLSQLSVEGLQSIRQAGTAPGSITEREWPIFQQLFNTLSYAQSEDAYKKALEEARTRLEEVRTNTERNYKVVEQQARGAAVPVRTEYEARRLPSGTWFVTPEGQYGRVR